MLNFTKQEVMGLLDSKLDDNLSVNFVGFNTSGSGYNSGDLSTYTTGGNLNSGATITNAVYRYDGNTAGPLTGWSYFTNYYYPQVIRESYPVYLQERAQDKGKQAFEIIKSLQDKKLMKLDKVSDFIDAMDTLIKIL